MSKKSSNDYLQFIADCSKKSGEKYNVAVKKGSDCNDEYNRLHKKKDVNEIIIKELIEPTTKPKKTVSFVEPDKPKKSKTKKPKSSFLDVDITEYMKEKGIKPKYITVKQPVKSKKKTVKPKTKSKKPSEWISYVKKCQLERGISYKDAMKLCSESYKLQKGKSGKSELSERPLPFPPSPQILVTPPEEEQQEEPIILTEEEITPQQQSFVPIFVPLSYRKYPLEAVPEKYRESERIRREREITRMGYNDLSEMEVYKNYPETQFSEKLFGNSFSIRSMYPDSQDVNIYGNPAKRNFYGMRYQPLKFQNPYKNKNLVGSGALNTAVIIEGLEKTGLFKASKDVLGSLTRKFDDWLSNPSATRQHRIISRLIPDMTYKYNKLKNELEVYGKSWKPLRVNNHKIAMLNIEDKINSLLMELEVL